MNFETNLMTAEESDLGVISGTLTFAPGDRSKSITVSIIDDQVNIVVTISTKYICHRESRRGGPSTSAPRARPGYSACLATCQLLAATTARGHGYLARGQIAGLTAHARVLLARPIKG